MAARLITRIGFKDDPNRKRVLFIPLGHGTYKELFTQAYGNSLNEAFYMAFQYAGIKVYTIFDAIEDIASAMEEGDE